MLEARSSQYRNVFLSVRKIFLIATLITFAGCTSLIKAGSLNKVHESFNEQNYKETLVLIRQAENLNELEPNLVAELTYMKALSLEAMGNLREANALYEYLKAQHVNTQYAWLAGLRLDKTDSVQQ